MSNKFVILYLDTDTEGNDLLDNVGNNITAGFYRYAWPFTDEPISGPFATAREAETEA